MLKFGEKLLPSSCLSYLAFRLAWRQTVEALIYQQQPLEDRYQTLSGEDFLAFEKKKPTTSGFLCEVPFLSEVAPQVQLDLLSNFWSRHISLASYRASLLDEAILYAACESAASLLEHDPHAVPLHLKGGPLDVTFPVDESLSAEIRKLYLDLPSEGDYLLIGQFLDVPPEECRKLKKKFGLRSIETEELFDLLGRWTIQPAMNDRLAGLLSPHEISRLRKILDRHIRI
ncbi:hypothetical protein Plim_1763 [Planctopirus limnophila DSM 3776]|uniref:Uncharacterized protein n=2 Tax=Planctopirus TaxID=1649480 RepID=D5SXM6_PLAL2|nr:MULTISPECIES: hypothetical protein [Planctopirus]ADG67593.1 hypothetical protein Plim_1763 [Planctopirus limnophila DSM 3776]ODA32626.1 hypothetical protein A6X21_19930 [Planctopirus hydrillae]